MSRTHDVTISAFDLDHIEAELTAERALADRLAVAIRKHESELPFRADYCDCQLYEALAVWMEARNLIGQAT